jgi:hypothetical protein
MIITISICVNRMARLLEGNVGKYAEVVEDVEGGRYMGLLSVSSV